MKKEKFVLEKLAVKSFVIKLENDNSKNYKGGGTESAIIPCPSRNTLGCGCPPNTSMSVIVGFNSQ